MKKVFTSRIFLVIVTAIICTTVTVGATAIYNASEVGFTPTDSSWHVNNMEDAINDLYSKGDIKAYLDNKNTSFGGNGVTYTGFIVGHKYLALYTSNFWSYENSDDGGEGSYISSGASDIRVISKAEADQRVEAGGKSYGAIITFTATDSSITLHYAYRVQHYAMKFVDIT